MGMGEGGLIKAIEKVRLFRSKLRYHQIQLADLKTKKATTWNVTLVANRERAITGCMMRLAHWEQMIQYSENVFNAKMERMKHRQQILQKHIDDLTEYKKTLL